MISQGVPVGAVDQRNHSPRRFWRPSMILTFSSSSSVSFTSSLGGVEQTLPSSP